ARPTGTRLAGAVPLLADGGSRVSRDAEPLRHAACGTPMEARWYCPTCARAVESSEADAARYVCLRGVAVANAAPYPRSGCQWLEADGRQGVPRLRLRAECRDAGPLP